MQCAISGEIPQTPVVCVKTGYVYERRLIEKHIEANGVDFVTQAPISKDDPLPLKSNNKIVRPRPPSATSVPGMLQLLQSEWDALMLETYTLKQHLHAVRQELAQALYKNDAASRVIAKLIQERDQARAALAKNGITAPSGGPAAMEIENAASDVLPEPVMNNMLETAKLLSKPRKKRVKGLAAEAANDDKIRSYELLSSHPLHSTTRPGILCMDLHSVNDSLVATGGSDSNIIIFNRSSGKVEETLKGHKKQVNDLKFHPATDVVFSASEDRTAMIWRRSDGKYSSVHTLSQHSEAVIGVTMHPSGDYFVTASADATWNFYDSATASLYRTVQDENKSGYTNVSFHPDGLILGCGTRDGFVRIFDLKTLKPAASFSEGHEQLSGLSFSENGYYLASADVKGLVKLWDLRKLVNFQNLNFNGPITALSFDESGSFLGVGSSEVHVVETKAWATVKSFPDHTAPVTGVRFGKKAAFVASASRDRFLKFFGSK